MHIDLRDSRNSDNKNSKNQPKSQLFPDISLYSNGTNPTEKANHQNPMRNNLNPLS